MRAPHNESSSSVRFRGREVSKYVLGTAQLGQVYGIANTDGLPDKVRSRNIVEAAWGAGARCFDTAQGYGDSETVLGQALCDSGISNEALVVTKLGTAHDPTFPEWVEASVMDSLKYLCIPSLFGVMLHRFDWIQYLKGDLGCELRRLRDQGYITCIGVSVYSVEEAITALDHSDIDIVQAPCNLWSPEQYLEGVFEHACRLKKLLCIRSIYLQGLLLMDSNEVKVKLPSAEDASRKWISICERFGGTPEDLCMQFAAALPAPIVIGADNGLQAERNGKIADVTPLSKKEIIEIYTELKPYLSVEITNPSLW